MIEIFMPRKLKFQVLLFMTFNVILWFVISDSAMGILDVLEARNIYSMTKKSYSFFILFQALLYVLVNIPFVFFLINHIDKPVQKILKVLNRIKEEDFSEQIEFCATNEFDEIKNSINVMSQELEKSIRLREEIENQRIMLFANMAHDLKTPITSIQGYSQALADGIVTSEEKAGEYIKTIYAKSQSMNDLIERMFEYVKLDSRENILHFEKTNLAELLRNCIASSYSEFEEKHIELEIQIPDECVLREVDSVEIKRVFTNLLNNVLAHNDGGIRCLVKMEKDGSVIVADSGDRIPEQVESQLFLPFVKGDDSRKSGKGSGLGLSLSQKIMERHSGKISYIKNYMEYTKAFYVKF